MEGGKEHRHGRVHAKDLRNKQKHKPDAAPAKKPVVLPQQPLPDPLQEDNPYDALAADQGDNFNDLAAQTATGGRFMLKSEKDWNNDITLGSGSDQFTKYFDLDVQQLALAISIIPFHERIDLDDVSLTEGIREKFRNDAAEKMKEFLKTSAGQSSVSNIRASGPPPSKPKEVEPVKMPLSISSTPVIAPKDTRIPVVQPDPKEDIQGWLDNVLDL